jgi:uncharacterized delta-60 repeat protein
MRNNFILNINLLFYLIFALNITSLAQAGSLDISFDTDGRVITPIGVSKDLGYSTAIQSDGKIVVAGYSDNGSKNDFALVRYNINGSLDSTFDTDGKVTTSIREFDDIGYSVAIQSDGKIVVAGYSENGSNKDFALARYNANGSLDITFDTDGKVTTSIGGADDFCYAVAIQSDGKILAFGYSVNVSNTDFALARYNTNGSLDSTFGADGKVITDIAGGNDWGFAMTIQPDGKILVAGTIIYGPDRDFGIVRYNTNGSLDTTFDTDGKVTTGFSASSQDWGYSVALQNDGKIVMAGYGSHPPAHNSDFLLARYNANGSLDNSFDSDGKVTTPIGVSSDVGYSIVIQPDNKIVAAGYYNSGPTTDFALIRYKSNGSLDSTFDFDGIATTNFGSSNSMGRSLCLQSDGKIVLAGYTVISSTDIDFCVSRYNVNNATGINEIDNQISNIEIYPNPFSTYTTIWPAKDLINASLIVHNILGQEVKKLNNLSGRIITFNRNDLPKGLYFIQLVQNNQVILSRKIVITD